CTGITFEGGMYHPGLLARGKLSEHEWQYDSEHDCLFNGNILIYRRGDWCSLREKPKSTFFHLDVKHLEGRLKIGCQELSNEYLYMVERDLRRLELEDLGTITIAELREELRSLIIN